MIVNNYILLLVLSVTIASFSQILLKKSAQKNYSSFVKEYVNPFVIIGYGMMVVSTIVTIIAYRGVEYKNGPIIESVGYILVMFLSRFFFSEAITRKKVLGNGLVLIGIIIFYI